MLATGFILFYPQELNSDAFFNVHSVDQIQNIIDNSATCHVDQSFSNTPPEATANGGGFTIPISTPFELTGTATDVNGDAMTFNWEQHDLGPGTVDLAALNNPTGNAPIFRSWLNPFKDLDASTLTLSNTGGTDHLAFDAVGIPGFQFIQEPIAYFNRTHHSNMDNWDHLVADDLKQAATVIASFVWHTSQRAEKLPRKAIDTAMKKSEE